MYNTRRTIGLKRLSVSIRPHLSVVFIHKQVGKLLIGRITNCSLRRTLLQAQIENPVLLLLKAACLPYRCDAEPLRAFLWRTICSTSTTVSNSDLTTEPEYLLKLVLHCRYVHVFDTAPRVIAGTTLRAGERTLSGLAPSRTLNNTHHEIFIHQEVGEKLCRRWSSNPR